MRSITTAVTHRFVASVIRGGWAIIRLGGNLEALGERVEAWAARRHCVEDALSIVVSDALSR
jgi:hypothetical protein